MENNSLYPCIIQITLIKQLHHGLGFLVRSRSESSSVIVSDLVSGSMAAESGLVNAGDTVVKVNDVSLVDKTYEEAISILKSIPVNSTVVLLLRCPDGYTAHLETRFGEDGLPRTVRITKPIDPPETFISRIKRTFYSSPKSELRENDNNTNIMITHASPLEYKGIPCVEQDGPRKELVGKGTDCTFESSYTQEASQIDDKTSKESQENLVGVYNCNVNAQLNTPIKIHVTRENEDMEASDKKMHILRERPLKNNADLHDDHGSPKGHDANNVDNFIKSKDEQREVDGEEFLPNGYKQDNNYDGRSKSSESGEEYRQTVSKDREGTCSWVNSPKKSLKLTNVANQKLVYTDSFYMKALESTGCTPERCVGSLISAPSTRAPGTSRPKAELIHQAKDFMDQYYASIKRQNTTAYQKRWKDVITAIENTGTYELTTNELTYGAKTAWRNAPRCIGRIQWSKLQVFDARHITTARGMFEAVCDHIKYGTNKGNIRSAITIFPPRTDERRDFRVWNPQLISYAGYKQPDGNVIGDPINVEFTELCQKLGWKAKGGRFDILPLVLQANGHDPELFEIPPDLVLEVILKHPKFPWFAELGLKWYALPAVSGMLFDCGGLEFTACPFNGWYMGTEIGARDLCDPYRYNILETVAQKMGLDTKKNSSLWKDLALVEVNVAVLYSYQGMGVTITDHHAAAESFMKHLENEQRLRGGCPADWVWIVPPMSGSLLPVFHQEMLLYKLKPSYEYQEAAWKTYVWKTKKDKINNANKHRRKIEFRQLARAVKFSAKLMGKALARRVKCTILYATETGKSEGFARTLCEIFKHAFNAKVLSMDAYDSIDLEHEALLLFVTSTFGNGDPPENGEVFAKTLFEMKHPEIKNDGTSKQTSYIRMSSSSLQSEDLSLNSNSKDERDDSPFTEDNLTVDTGTLGNVRYSVFGLGSRAYPNFCAFARFLDTILLNLGAEKISKMGEGDELCGQEESFKIWAHNVFKAACETFCVGDENTVRNAVGSFSQTDFTWSPGKFRLTPSEEKSPDICEGLAKLHGKAVFPSQLIESKQLQSSESSRQTLLVRLDTQEAYELLYSPGDHLAVFAENSPILVDGILARLNNAPPVDQDIKIEMQSERTTPLGNMKSWERFPKFPICTLRAALCRYLDITTPPSQSFLKILATQATQDCDKEALENLANDLQAYEDWKQDKFPHLLEVLEEFPSVKIPAALILTQLPVLQQRYYSISSSPKVYPGEIHATVAVVKYRTQGDMGPLHEGVCSSWINRIVPGTIVPCLVRTAPSFHLPEDNTLPVIMVGPGTGIAPFRSFWQQRKIDMEMSTVPHKQDKSLSGWGSMYLYFGCRRSQVDDIYRDELQTAKEEGVLTNVYTALSREPDKPKMYVQDYLHLNLSDVYNSILRDGGHIYVCGDVKMASDVTSTLETIFQEEGKMSAQDAKNFVQKLRDSNRFHEDIFGVTLRSSEVTDKARSQARKAWMHINSNEKLNRSQSSIKATDRKEAPKRPKAPLRQVFSQDYSP
ncbi:hypothetical protein CHS0354_043096 [Potamilus streckersoni]|uniref:Nitric oxide synthase 1 n=1 Tax=Potamilus streckersoni TaxID=2493646 RepID=A0AAE0RME0_9BIVA|nr:hypothetical protein CHS0354_043096 [Potamilus streckersoni]